MNYISTTELRTKTSEVIETLLKGGVIDLVHRSKVVGEIRPKKAEGKVFNAKRMLKLVKELNFEPLTDEEVERRYRAYMMKRHGKNIPRHK